MEEVRKGHHLNCWQSLSALLASGKWLVWIYVGLGGGSSDNEKHLHRAMAQMQAQLDVKIHWGGGGLGPHTVACAGSQGIGRRWQ